MTTITTSPSKTQTTNTPTSSPVNSNKRSLQKLFEKAVTDSTPPTSPKKIKQLPLPMPLSSGSVSNFSRSTFQTPPTPRRMNPSEANSPFKKLHDNLSTGYLEFNDRFYSLTKLAEGSFSSVYILKDGQEQMTPMAPNSEIVIKAYHGNKSGFIQGRLNNYLHNTLQNYDEVKALGLPVAEIYNRDALFIIQKKIPLEIDTQNSAHIEQVKNFFKLSKEKHIMMDLIPSNFRVDEEGVVTLIDFIEDRDDGFEIFRIHALKEWRKIVPDFSEE